MLYGWPTSTSVTTVGPLQNVAARLVTGTRRREHITPVLRDLHWLPVRRHVDCLLFYKSLRVLAPTQHTCLKIVGLFYTTHFVDIFLQPRWTVGICIVPRIRIRLIGDRNFAVAGPRLWSSLSTALYCHSTCLRLLIWWRIMDCVIMCRL